jgi:hypothetical protein
VYLDLEAETSKLGMEINNKKTKYLVTATYKHRRNTGDLRIGNETFETVQSYQYLGNVTSNTNSNNKCIKERIMMGNKAYYANRHLFNSSLIQEAAVCRYTAHWYVQWSPYLLTPWSRVLLEKLTSLCS